MELTLVKQQKAARDIKLGGGQAAQTDLFTCIKLVSKSKGKKKTEEKCSNEIGKKKKKACNI